MGEEKSVTCQRFITVLIFVAFANDVYELMQVTYGILALFRYSANKASVR